MMGGSVDKQKYLFKIVNEQSNGHDFFLPKTVTNPSDLMVPTLFSATQV